MIFINVNPSQFPSLNFQLECVLLYHGVCKVLLPEITSKSSCKNFILYWRTPKQISTCLFSLKTCHLSVPNYLVNCGFFAGLRRLPSSLIIPILECQTPCLAQLRGGTWKLSKNSPISRLWSSEKDAPPPPLTRDLIVSKSLSQRFKSLTAHHPGAPQGLEAPSYPALTTLDRSRNPRPSLQFLWVHTQKSLRTCVTSLAKKQNYRQNLGRNDFIFVPKIREACT